MQNEPLLPLHVCSSTSWGALIFCTTPEHQRKPLVVAFSTHTAKSHRWDQPSVIRGSFVCYDEHDSHFYIAVRLTLTRGPQEMFVDWIIMCLFNWRQCHSGHPHSLVTWGKMVGEEWTFRNCLCRSTWYLNSTMKIRQLSRSFTGVNVAPQVRKCTHSLPRVLLFRTVLPATWFQIVRCISNSRKQNPVGKHVRLKNSITDRKLKRPLGSFAQSRKTTYDHSPLVLPHSIITPWGKLHSWFFCPTNSSCTC